MRTCRRSSSTGTARWRYPASCTPTTLPMMCVLPWPPAIWGHASPGRPSRSPGATSIICAIVSTAVTTMSTTSPPSVPMSTSPGCTSAAGKVGWTPTPGCSPGRDGARRYGPCRGIPPWPDHPTHPRRATVMAAGLAGTVVQTVAVIPPATRLAIHPRTRPHPACRSNPAASHDLRSRPPVPLLCRSPALAPSAGIGMPPPVEHATVSERPARVRGGSVLSTGGARTRVANA
jgi:hypothetical protein